eukprot:evm.model.NODE_499_length_36058_cov_18.539797.13
MLDETRSLETHAPAAADGLVWHAYGRGRQGHAHEQHKSQPKLESSHTPVLPQAAPGPDNANDTPPGHAVAKVLQKITKWKDYTNYGQPLGNSRVIPMKTPLPLDLQRQHFPTPPSSSAVLHKEAESEARVHTIGKFVKEQADLGRNVGLVVDLSNHSCLYEEDLNRDCPLVKYEHFFFVAKEIPSRAICQRVNRCITAFVSANPQDYVAIHCSYGWNRTGFVCATYLAEELHYGAAQALAAFALARAPGIRHEHFISEFLSRYGDGGGDAVGMTGVRSVVGQGTGGEGGTVLLAAHIAHIEGNNRETNNETLGSGLGQEMLQALQKASRREEGGFADESRRISLMRSCCLS